MKNKNEKGITLIALVITIVVLLILAGVAISMSINSDGLFGKANEAAEGWNTAVKEEGTAMGGLLLDLDKASPTPVTVSETVQEEWKGNSNISAVATSVAGKVPVPAGFVVSEIEGENTISGGLVIYQVDKTTASGAEFWTKKTTINGKEYLDCQLNYNQYVWIPVADINDMVMCKSNTGNSVCNLKLINGELQCTNKAHSETKTDLCGRLYYSEATTNDETAPKVYTTNMNFADRSQVWEENGRREPDVLDDDSTSTNIDANKENETTLNITNDFKSMAISVAKYGGFYVSRYEIGDEGVSKKNQPVLVAGTSGSGALSGSVADAIVSQNNQWYGLYDVIKNSETTNTHMIYESQHDQMIKFIGNEAQTGHIAEELKTERKTGTNEKDKMCNIYDLEGNHTEWTAAAYSYESSGKWYYYRIGRGGNFYNVATSGFIPVASRYYGRPTLTGCPYGARATLHL